MIIDKARNSCKAANEAWGTRMRSYGLQMGGCKEAEGLLRLNLYEVLKQGHGANDTPWLPPSDIPAEVLESGPNRRSAPEGCTGTLQFSRLGLGKRNENARLSCLPARASWETVTRRLHSCATVVSAGYRVRR